MQLRKPVRDSNVIRNDTLYGHGTGYAVQARKRTCCLDEVRCTDTHKITGKVKHNVMGKISGGVT